VNVESSKINAKVILLVLSIFDFWGSRYQYFPSFSTDTETLHCTDSETPSCTDIEFSRPQCTALKMCSNTCKITVKKNEYCNAVIAIVWV